MATTPPSDYRADWLCRWCGDDFRAWLQIPGEDRRCFLRQRPEYDIVNLIDERCPRCGAPYAPPTWPPPRPPVAADRPGHTHH